VGRTCGSAGLALLATAKRLPAFFGFSWPGFAGDPPGPLRVAPPRATPSRLLPPKLAAEALGEEGGCVGGER
jgi:hypothetical protein